MRTELVLLVLMPVIIRSRGSNKCSDPRDPGTCSNYETKYYYDKHNGQCRRFWYGGCGGNANKFDSLELCEQTCVNGRLHQDDSDNTEPNEIPDSEILLGITNNVHSPVSDLCQLSSDSGSCRNYTAKWFFDSKKQDCARFWYGGCNGNENRFDDSEACKRRCFKEPNPGSIDVDKPDQPKHHQKFSAACQQPKDAGTCRDYALHWHFQVGSASCSQFWYGGCGGNRNRFTTKDECEAECVQGEQTAPELRPAQPKLGCAHSKYGCCPGKDVEAKGPNHKGCKENCEDSIYGCCSDGVTPAEGPNQDGCEIGSGDVPCEKTEFGCCSDGITTALGPSFKGCDDVPDSERRHGGTSGVQTTDTTEKKCTAPESREVCKDYEVKWRFDNQKLECVRHWWGGCKDNGNIFESKEDCAAECKNKVVVTHPDSPKQVKCTAPESRNLCTKYAVKWRFDTQKQECARHWWGGCEDNGNVFESQSDCEAICMNTLVIQNPDTVDPDFVNICDMDKDAGPCTENIHRFYYDPRDRKCKVFYYGGCQGNENNFAGIEDCQRQCMGGVIIAHAATTTDKPETSAFVTEAVRTTVEPVENVRSSINMSGESFAEKGSTLKIKCTAVGPTPPTEIEWFLNGDRIRSEDNDLSVNTFVNLQLKQSLVSELVIKNIDQGDAGTYVCRSKPYGDVDSKRITVLQRAAVRTTVEPVENVRSSINMSGESFAEKGSTLKIKCTAVGPTPPTEIEWFFNGVRISSEDNDLSVNTFVNPQLKQSLVSELVIKNIDQGDAGTYLCRSKPYGDVSSKEITVLQREAPESTEQRDPAAVCLMKAETGPCRANMPRWHYDHRSGTCLQFVYGGCKGNNNNFETVEECNSFCNDKEVCHQPREVGLCRAAIPRFYFDTQTRSCQNFIYGGCVGNLNNFDTKEACDRKCHRFKDSGSHVDVASPDVDKGPHVCQLMPEKGNCRGYNIKWYYLADRKRCGRFVYTGCGGNGNQFDSEQECSDACLKVDSTDDRDSVGKSTQSTVFYPKSFSTASVPREDHKLVRVKLGAPAVLTCTLRNHGVLWLHNGFSLTSSSRHQVYNNGTLFLWRVTEDMTGIYTCRISVGYNEHQEEKFKVEVYVPPRLLHGPALVSAKPGHTAVVHCQAVGSPQPVVSWNRGGRVLQTNNHYTVFTNGTLIIHNVLIQDAGEYECSAENGISATRKTISLSIKETIGADIQRHQGIFTEGETINLHCKGTGYPTPKLEWVKEGHVLASHGKILVANGDLTVNSATIEDAGMYKCIAFNDRGRAEDVTTVQIKFHSPLTRCEDTMAKTKCHLIVSGKLCGFRVFTSKCCHSCRKAGFL